MFAETSFDLASPTEKVSRGQKAEITSPCSRRHQQGRCGSEEQNKSAEGASPRESESDREIGVSQKAGAG